MKKYSKTLTNIFFVLAYTLILAALFFVKVNSAQAAIQCTQSTIVPNSIPASDYIGRVIPDSSNYYWQVIGSCSGGPACSTNSDCPQNTSDPSNVDPASSNWCYGFAGPTNSSQDWRCLQLQHIASSNPTPTTGGSSSCTLPAASTFNITDTCASCISGARGGVQDIINLGDGSSSSNHWDTCSTTQLIGDWCQNIDANSCNTYKNGTCASSCGVVTATSTPTPAPLTNPTGLVTQCSQDGTSATFSWNAVSGASSYTVRVNNDDGNSDWCFLNDFSVGVSGTSYTTGTFGSVYTSNCQLAGTPATSVPAPVITPGVPYDANVQAISATGGTSSEVGFNWSGCPTTPTLAPTTAPSATVPPPTSTPVGPTPTPGPVPVSYRMAEGIEGNLDISGSYVTGSYSLTPTLVSYTFKDLTSGAKIIWVRFFYSDGSASADYSNTINYSPSPLISSISCDYNPTGAGILVTIQGSNFGSHAQQGTGSVLVNNENASITSWSDSIVATIPDRPTGNLPVKLTTDDGRVINGQCTINTTTATFTAKIDCRLPNSFAASNVSTKVFESAAGVTSLTPLYSQNISLDQNGLPQGFSPSLQVGHNYQLIISAPNTTSRNIQFTALAGTTNLSTISLPIGDIFPSTPDGYINVFDKSEMEREWTLVSSTGKLADFNGDSEVNSLDYSCLMNNYGKSNESFVSFVAPTSTPNPTAVVPTSTPSANGSGQPTSTPTQAPGVGGPSATTTPVSPNIITKVWITSQATAPTVGFSGVAGKDYQIVDPYPGELKNIAYNLPVTTSTTNVPVWVRFFNDKSQYQDVGPIYITYTAPSTTVITDSSLASPWGIAVVGSQVWVTNTPTNSISKFNFDGSPAGVITGNSLSSPEGIALVNGQVWVANSFGSSISKFDSSGNAAGVITGNSLNGPSGLVVVNSQVWVTNYGTNSILKFDFSGNPVGTAITGGSLTLPQNIALVNGQVWVTVGPSYASSIAKYDSNGNSLGVITGNSLNLPKGIAVVSNQAWVVNFGTNSILPFNFDGSSAGTPITDSSLSFSQGIAVVSNQAWVVNAGVNNKPSISRFNITGTTANLTGSFVKK